MDNNEQPLKISLSTSEMEVKKKYYLTLSKMFIQQYGINFALLLSEIDRITYACEANSDEQGFLQLSYNLFKKDIRLSKEQVKPLIDKMMELNFVEVKYTHNGRRKLYKLNRKEVASNLFKLINKYDDKKRK
ncbi:MAG: hypothetical protein PHN55_16200 [Dysgonamonadaceae bacterium]|nr:hypothetical protein [Dysgonamonadaceae bacterium]